MALGVNERWVRMVVDLDRTDQRANVEGRMLAPMELGVVRKATVRAPRGKAEASAPRETTRAPQLMENAVAPVWVVLGPKVPQGVDASTRKSSGSSLIRTVTAASPRKRLPTV